MAFKYSKQIIIFVINLCNFDKIRKYQTQNGLKNGIIWVITHKTNSKLGWSEVSKVWGKFNLILV